MKPYLITHAPVTLKEYRANHDQGSAAAIDATDPSGVRIDPVEHWNSSWYWFGVRHGRLGGTTPHFLVTKTASAHNPAAGEHFGMWAQAADSDAWIDFANVAAGASDIEFYHGAAFPSGKIYIARFPMFPFSRVRRLVAAWSADPRAGETASTAGNVIACATARDAGDGSGRSVPALPFYGLKLAGDNANPKNAAILTALNHPMETPGAFAFEGFVSWLLDGSPEAEFLLDWTEFFIYPCINPQGVWAGFFRSCPQNPALDHNRQWHTSGVLECVDAFKTAMAADTGGSIEIGLDFHASDGDDGVFASCMDNTDPAHAAFAAAVAALDPAFDLRNLTTAGVLHKYWSDAFSPTIALTIEQSASRTRAISDWKAFGANIGKALATLLAQSRFAQGPGVGARDFNGTTDRLDWANVANLKNSPVTISAWVYLDRVNTNQYFFIGNNAANGQGLIFWNSGGGGSGSLTLSRNGTGVMYASSANGVLTAGAWMHVLGTHPGGGIGDHTQVKLYKNGVELALSAGANGSAEFEYTGTWSLGGRSWDDTRNLDGRIAQVGVWNRVLSATEIANLAAGYAPDLAAASNLQFYFKGNTSSLANSVPGGADATADGTTQLSGAGIGPGIIY